MNLRGFEGEFSNSDINSATLAIAHHPDVIRSNIYKYEKHLLPIIRQYVSPHACLLDYGCGSGEMLMVAKAAGYQVSGYDPSPEAVATARNLIGMSSIYSDTQAITEKFDLVMCISVLQYSANPKATLAKMVSFLKPNGVLIIGHPNRYSVYQFLTNQRFPAHWCQIPQPDHVQKIGVHLGVSDFLYTSEKKRAIKRLILMIEKLCWFFKVDVSFQKVVVYRKQQA